ncbi:hypothetical protein J3R83DRAFT_2598 [Lanmaoa asiatica]|nr:hypothetical protein J3R83DRAFT_2598 [Lanmaoa asiatica]
MRRRRRDTPPHDDHLSETDVEDIVEDIVDDENDENAFSYHRESSLLVLRTPLSHSRASQDTPLRDITDQFFHPPSPSPVRISNLKRSAPNTIEPPRRPKKPKSLAYPADPPNWLCSRPSSTLPPSSPFPPSTTNVDRPHRSLRHRTPPSRVSDSDPFGFVAVERALKAKRVAPALAPRKPTSRINAIKSPPRSTVLPSALSPVFASFSQLHAPVPTNN